MNLYNRNRPTDIEKKLMVTKGKKWRGRINWEIGIDVYTLQYIEQVTNKDREHRELCLEINSPFLPDNKITQGTLLNTLQ